MNDIKKAIVTGATSGIGLEICKCLIQKDIFVFGIGRDFENVSLPRESFEAVKVDLRKRQDIEREIRRIKKGVTLLINCAGVGYFGLHEELSSDKIHDIMAVNVEAPMIITSLMLRDLKKTGGNIINISSHCAGENSPRAAAYAASKAALSAFSKNLSAEYAKYGVFVTTLSPDITRTDFYKNAPFTFRPEADYALSPKDIAAAVAFVLSAPHPIEELTLLPPKRGVIYKNSQKLR